MKVVTQTGQQIIADLRNEICGLESDVAGWREAWEEVIDAIAELRLDTMDKPVGKRHATPTQLLRVMKRGLRLLPEGE